MLVDSHCHLDFPDFADDIENVVARARAAGVGTLVTICTKVSEVGNVFALADRFPEVYCSVGIHPHEAAHQPDTDVETLVRLAEHPKVVGIGECGLDYHYDHSPRQRQQAVFRTHITAARRTGLPLIVHSRDADSDTVDLLREGSEPRSPGEARLRGVIHCFSSTAELSGGALALGFYISLAGIVTFKTAEALRGIAAAVPADRLLVETDAPYLAPVPKRGKRNEPSFVAHTAAKLSELRGTDPAALAQQTTANFFALFDRARPPSDPPVFPPAEAAA